MLTVQIVFHKYKDKIMSINVLNLKKIEYISSFDGESYKIDSDFMEKFNLNGKIEVKFIGSNTVDIKADDVIAINFK